MDLLKCFGEGERSVKAEKLDEEDVDLSLGLSSNGRFGVEPPRAVANGRYDNNHRLNRSSSISDLSNFGLETEDPMSLTLYPPLTRTCSLPIETEVEWKKRKELQSIRRSEAKRKRVEKLNGRVVNGLSPEGNRESKIRNLMNGNESRRSSPTALLPPRPRPASIGSPASGGSSGVSDLESQPFSGNNKDSELKTSATRPPVFHRNSNSQTTPSSQIINGRNESLKMMLANMPCVSTKDEGVNGKKIQGFLYRKDEDVRIVCVCHGCFLTPAEFVKHGGGGDVEHPLRHIVVMPPSL